MGGKHGRKSSNGVVAAVSNKNDREIEVGTQAGARLLADLAVVLVSQDLEIHAKRE